MGMTIRLPFKSPISTRVGGLPVSKQERAPFAAAAADVPVVNPVLSFRFFLFAIFFYDRINRIDLIFFTASG